MTEPEARARDTAFTKLYDVIDALPPEERQGAILEEAEKVIRTVVRQRATSDLEKWQNNLIEYQNRMGDPADLEGRELRQYDTEVKRLENLIRENEQKSRS